MHQAIINSCARTAGIVALLCLAAVSASETLLALPVDGAPADTTRVLAETTRPKWTISRHLVGLHLVYTFAPDEAYRGGRFAKWVKDSGLRTARYPGGTIVKYWDWKNPTGVMTGDPWDPQWDAAKNQSPDKWMSLDEYLHFIEQTGIIPLLGVNAASGRVHDREQESIDRAADMVAYVKKKGHGGAFWYIGNEEAHWHGGTEGYAKVFRKHALAMKQVDPAIRLFWNSNHVNENVIATFLKHDGGTSDGLETHGKWPYGGKPKGLKPGTREDWLNEVPMTEWKSKRLWRSAAARYRKIAEQLGRENYLIANNEYGIGNVARGAKGFSRYDYGLLMTDMLQEHFLGNWDMTCFWDTVRGDLHGLMSARNDFRLNPFHLGMALLADAQGGEMLDAGSDNKFVYGFACAKGDTVLLYLINKTEKTQKLNIELTGKPMRCLGGRIMRDTPDHWGELAALAVRPGDTFETELPPLSFCQIVFERKP